MVLVISIREILQNGTTLPDLEFLTFRILNDDCRDTTIRVDVKVPLLFLLVLEEVDLAYLEPICVRVDQTRN